MPRLKLTASGVEKIRPPKDGQQEYFDELLPSFGIRVSYSGTKAWFVMTRVDGKLIRMTIGRFPAVTLKQARAKASEFIRLANEGIDPRQVEKERKRKKDAQARNTFEFLAEQFWVSHVERNLKPTTASDYKRILFGSDTENWRTRAVNSITKRDVLDVVEGIQKRAPGGAADNALAYLRKFFSWCVDREIINFSPAERIQRLQPTKTRTRVLSEDEIRLVWQALELESGLFGPLFKLLLLTGQRRGEVSGMRYEELSDIDTPNAIWLIPGARTKNGREHLVPVSPAVVQIIHSVQNTGPLLFSTDGEHPVSGFSKAKNRIDKRISDLAKAEGLPPVKDWRLHDLRRTMVTMMNEKLRIPPHVVEACINHISGSAKAGVAGVYNRALYMDERREALKAWSELISNFAGSNRISA